MKVRRYRNRLVKSPYFNGRYTVDQIIGDLRVGADIECENYDGTDYTGEMMLSCLHYLQPEDAAPLSGRTMTRIMRAGSPSKYIEELECRSRLRQG